jgi:sugar phosphate isomerase/epimerase
MSYQRRDLLQWGLATSGVLLTSRFVTSGVALAEVERPRSPQEIGFGFGLVTYMWGAQWDLPTLIKNCTELGLRGVELRTTHAHKVEPSLTDEQREEVRKRFEDVPVVLVGLGSDERFDNPDPAVVRKAVERTKEFIRLSHDIGGSGVKVKPDKFHKDVPREKTIEQIGRALNELGEYAAGFGQQVRLEVHGECGELPTIKAILDIATDENVAICWNSNGTDLRGDGFEKNFDLVRSRFGQTLHVRELDTPGYPWAGLFERLVATDYHGYVLLEAASKPADIMVALAGQVKLFEEHVAAAFKS